MSDFDVIIKTYNNVLDRNEIGLIIKIMSQIDIQAQLSSYRNK